MYPLIQLNIVKPYHPHTSISSYVSVRPSLPHLEGGYRNAYSFPHLQIGHHAHTIAAMKTTAIAPRKLQIIAIVVRISEGDKGRFGGGLLAVIDTLWRELGAIFDSTGDGFMIQRLIEEDVGENDERKRS